MKFQNIEFVNISFLSTNVIKVNSLIENQLDIDVNTSEKTNCTFSNIRIIPILSIKESIFKSQKLLIKF